MSDNCRCVLMPLPEETLRAERDAALAVLSDLLEERGQSWVARLLPLKEQLRSALFSAEAAADGDCLSCGMDLSGVHDADCTLAPLLAIMDERFLPGLVERAHAAAEIERLRAIEKKYNEIRDREAHFAQFHDER